jgi:transcriptional regulator with XRE-family HTH domain
MLIGLVSSSYLCRTACLSLNYTAYVNKFKEESCCLDVFFSLMGFKENLKSELAYQDMLVKELSASTGISRHTIDNYLNVRARIPTADVAVKIAQVLGVSVEYLITGKEDSPENASLSPEIRLLIKNIRQLDEKDRKMVCAIAQLYNDQR